MRSLSDPFVAGRVLRTSLTAIGDPNPSRPLCRPVVFRGRGEAIALAYARRPVLDLHALNIDPHYFVAVEWLNRNGVSQQSATAAIDR